MKGKIFEFGIYWILKRDIKRIPRKGRCEWNVNETQNVN